MSRVETQEPVGARFAIVGDDLTGACDSAVAFARRGLRVEALLESRAAYPAEGVWAISTESRDLTAKDAIRRLRDVTAAATQAAEIFKKIDSVFRGNTFVEIGAAIDCFPCDLALLSPAYPAMGRIVREGVLHIDDTSESRRIDLREGLSGVGLEGFPVVREHEEIAELQNAMRAAMQGEQKLVLCDAGEEEDLRRVVAAARGLGRRILWIGSGGLADALASEISSPRGPQTGAAEEGVVLLFVGSDHAVTQRQIESLRGSASVFEASVSEFSGAPEECEFVVLKVPREGTREAQIQRAVARLSRRVACCLMTGGDTAMLVCRALGVRSLVLKDEFARGLPQGVAVGGMLDGVPVVLKSGGFGGVHVLCGLACRFVKRKELA